MRILKNRYPYLGNSIDSVLLRWDYSNVLDADGYIRGAHVDKKGELSYPQEGRLGYEEYAAKGFMLWGFKAAAARRARAAAAPAQGVRVVRAGHGALPGDQAGSLMSRRGSPGRARGASCNLCTRAGRLHPGVRDSSARALGTGLNSAAVRFLLS